MAVRKSPSSTMQCDTFSSIMATLLTAVFLILLAWWNWPEATVEYRTKIEYVKIGDAVDLGDYTVSYGSSTYIPVMGNLGPCPGTMKRELVWGEMAKYIWQTCEVKTCPCYSVELIGTTKHIRNTSCGC